MAIVVDVDKCQRCGQDHEQMVFEELSNPIDEWKYWAICRVTGQPVLLLMQDDEKERPS